MQEVDQLYEGGHSLSPPVVWYPTPNDPPWFIPSAIGVWFFSVLAIIILPNLFVLPYLRAQEIPFSDSEALLKFVQSDPIAVLLSLIAIIPAHILTIVVAWLVVT